eukprot:4720326-Pleurochrysis_carterae.AAC.4
MDEHVPVEWMDISDDLLERVFVVALGVRALYMSRRLQQRAAKLMQPVLGTAYCFISNGIDGFANGIILSRYTHASLVRVIISSYTV